MIEDKVIYGSILLYMASFLGAVGGIGGGGLNLPLLIVALEYSVDRSVMLSLCAVVGSTIAQAILNSMARHPVVKSRPLIMWEILILMLPLQIAGSGVGKVINKIMPALSTSLFAMVVLLFTGYKVMLKGLAMYKKEEETKLKSADISSYEMVKHGGQKAAAVVNPLANSTECAEDENHGSEDGEDYTDMPENGETGKQITSYEVVNSEGEAGAKVTPEVVNPLTSDIVATEEQNNDSTDVAKDMESQTAVPANVVQDKDRKEELPPLVIPWHYLKAFGAMWVIYIILSSVGKLAFERCSAGYWTFYFLTFPPLFITSYWGYNHIKAFQEANPDSVVTGDLVFSEVGVQPLMFAFGVGVTGALIGVGGGILMTPLLLGLHITPNSASATTSMMSFTTGLTLLIQYLAAGEFVFEVGFWNMFLGFSGGYTGRYFAIWFVKKYNRQSPITFAVAVVIVLAIGMLIYGTTGLEDGTKSGNYCE